MSLDQLDRAAGELEVFVFGPGFGESVLVVIPPDEWVVVDCLRRHRPREIIPPARALDTFGARAAVVALSHPHLDHADGFAALLDRRKPGALVGCMPTQVSDPQRRRASTDASRVLRESATEAALAAIIDAWDREPESRWELLAGQTRNVGDGRIHVLHPADPDEGRRLASRNPNAASSPLLVEWRNARVLLGADLLWPQWESLSQAMQGVGPADVLKAPHHGSKNAQHPIAIGEPPPTDRPCFVTPWNRGGCLPRFEAGEGLDMLLAAHESVDLSALPVAVPVPPNRRIRRDALYEGVERRRFGDELVLEVEPAPHDPLGAWCYIAIDSDGDVLTRTRGEVAVTVLP